MVANGSHTSLCDEASPPTRNRHDHTSRSAVSLLPIQQQQQQTQLDNSVVPTGIIVTNQLIIEAN